MKSPSPAHIAAARLNRGYLICIGATFLLSTTAIFIRYLTEEYRMPALVLAFWRDLFVVIGLLAGISLFKPSLRHIQKSQVGFFLAYGLILAAFNALWTFSVDLNGAAVATVLAYSSAAFTAILGWWIFSEPLNAPKVLVVLVSIIGCALVSGAYNPATWQVNPFGIITGILTGLGYAAYSLMGKASANRGISAWTVLLYGFSFATVFLLGFNLISSLAMGSQPAKDLFWLGTSTLGWAVLILLAIGPTIGGFGLYTLSLGYLPASIANLIATLEPVLTALLAYLFLGEQLTMAQITGSLLIIGGVIILRLYENRKFV